MLGTRSGGITLYSLGPEVNFPFTRTFRRLADPKLKNFARFHIGSELDCHRDKS